MKRKQASLEEIQRKLKERLPELRERYGVKFLGILGSYVRGEQGLRSDLDILVEFEAAPSLLEFVRLEEYLSTVVGVKVDLVMKTALKPRIGQRILAEVIPI